VPNTYLILKHNFPSCRRLITSVYARKPGDVRGEPYNLFCNYVDGSPACHRVARHVSGLHTALCRGIPLLEGPAVAGARFN